MPLAGLGEAGKAVAAYALREVADTTKVRLTYKWSPSDPQPEPWESRLQIQGLQLRMSKSDGSNFQYRDTKIVQVIPSRNGNNIAYSFGLYTPEVPSDDALNIFVGSLQQIISRPFEDEYKIFSLKDNDAYTSVKRVESIATQFGEGWDYSILKAASVPSVKDGAKDSTLYTELWTDYASAGENDYMVGGWWLLAPNNPAGDYRFGAIAKGENYYPSATSGPIKPAVIGDATYKGNASGLHTSSEDGIQRLLGKVTLTADFQTTAERGTIGGKIDNLTLNGERASGEILLPEVTLGAPLWTLASLAAEVTTTSLNLKTDIGNIKGINYMGDWAGTFQGDSSGTDQPTGIVGVVGGSGGGNSFVASFGAKKVEDED